MRNKIVLVFCMAAFLFAGAAESAEKQDNLFYWLRVVSSKVQKKKIKQGTAAVSGVRGDAEKAPDELYWKDAIELGTDEAKEFAGIIDHIERGENDTAILKLEDFLKSYPNSPVKGDAEEGLSILKTNK
ncbi:MAG: hypothetical protein HY954_09855 [Deltaproteobacteria bacterium]|nr:hypothetical protein [Deltaproteobacteria bacterium]